MEATGSLIIRAYTSRSVIPVPDVSIAVSVPGNGGRRLLGVRVTDENGLTEPVIIATPPLKDSLAAGTEYPFTTCEVRAHNPLFEKAVIENVQIFAGIRTVQPIELIPVADHPDSRSSAEFVDITPQNL